MFQFDAWWFPDGETHLPAQLRAADYRVGGRLTYQAKKYKHVLPYCRRRIAVDVGAHVGLWTYLMTLNFAGVYAFEPVFASAACWLRNLHDFRNRTQLYPYALGDCEAVIGMICDGPSSGNARVTTGADVLQRRLDAYTLGDVDFLKIDCEGYELAVLRGAEALITRCRPTILVEQKPGCAVRYGWTETAAVDWLVDRGARVRWMAGGDYLLSWDMETR